jgi:hypothetical protein
VVFDATVRERNADLGARADVALLVNGTEVARQRGTSVGANGTVTVRLATNLTVKGFYNVGFRLINAVPADDNPTDNAVVVPIEITTPP